MTPLEIQMDTMINDPLRPNLSSRLTQQDLINNGLMAIGMAPMGITKAKTAYELAHDVASKNAEKMLGLPKGNTYIDRAKALGYDTDAYRGTSRPRESSKENTYWSKLPDVANAYTSRFFTGKPSIGGNVMPLKIRLGNVSNEPGHLWKTPENIDSVVSHSEGLTVNPSNVRSRFAAFDPARLSESDLLAGLAPYLGIGGLLGIGLYDGQEID
jgi:hypothetical protein